MSYKTTDGLMRHLRQNGINIEGSLQKRQLINTGYFTDIKGIDFSSLQEILSLFRLIMIFI